MTKIRKVQGGGQIFFCPGCQSKHAVNLKGSKSVWTYNNDPKKPTFSPSLLVTYDGKDNALPRVCHSFIADGMIKFLPDSTHHLSGKTVEIPDWPYLPNKYWGIDE